MKKKLNSRINLRKSFRFIIIILACFQVISPIFDYSLYSQDKVFNIELKKKWEAQIPQDSSFVRPSKLILDKKTGTIWTNYLEKLYNIDILTGKVNFEYHPPEQQLICDFIVKDGIVFLTTVDRKLKNDSFLLKLKLYPNDQEILWNTKLPIKSATIQHIEHGEILVSCRYLVDEENGNLESLCSIFDRVTLNTLYSSSTFPKENTMYWFVSPWKDIFQLDLPFLWVLENKTHLNIPENITEFCPYFSVLEDGKFLIVSYFNKSIFIFSKDGEIEKKINIPDFAIRFDDSSVIKTGLNQFIDTSIYKNYIVSSPMSIKEGFKFYLFDFENETVSEKTIKTDCSYPLLRTLPTFWDGKLFIFSEESKYGDGYSTIHILDTSNLDSITILREETSKIIEPKIGEFSLTPFLPFIFLEESDSQSIIVMYQNKVCLYDFVENH